MSSSVFPENIEPQTTSMQPVFLLFSENISLDLWLRNANISIFCEMAEGILYIVPTPGGNLDDMTFRAVKVLGEADLVLAEDTRTTSVLLQHFGIRARQLMSHHKFNEHQTVALIREKILAGACVALVSDAGTPGISDPGFLLARECAHEGITVQTLPGATACIPAIVSSGLPCDRFCFEGFLPQKKGRQTILDDLSGETRTMIFYESPRRLVKTLEQMSAAFGPERECSVAREISKVHEESVRGTLAEVLEHFRQTEPKGEIVLIVAGKPQPAHREHRNKYRTEEEDCGDVPNEEL